MRSIADIKAWQEMQVLIIGVWLSKLLFWPGKTEGNNLFNNLKSEGYFGLDLTPTVEEHCSDDEAEYDYCDNDDNDSDDGDDDEYLCIGQQLRNGSRNRVYGESSRQIRSHRAYLY
ncbi:hypothetical protein MFIFM68171_00776 [Madurella fahalii]|uniref:Uncharacterized protein n=1 Tax=Madurella fahalii TaxID=1157608 RepID=A0ABQ0FYH4_9PEZI